MFQVLVNFFTRRSPDIATPCAGEVDSAAAVAAGLHEWFPEFAPGCASTR